MKNSLLWFCRIFVGVLFIFSGLIKANDPVGFGIKLDEYYEVFAAHFPWTHFIFGAQWFIDTVNMQAVFLTTLEVALGIALLLGIWKNLVAWLLLLLILFFTWLTGYSAVTGSVTDCGCFGDAIPLTPWQSFYKDMILTTLIVIIFFMRKRIKPIMGGVPSAVVFLLVTAFTLWVNVHVLRHDVFLDWRPYAQGNNIAQLMEIPADAEKPVVRMTYIYKENASGSEKKIEVMSNEPNGPGIQELNKITASGNYTFVDRNDKVIDPGFVPKISDFAVSGEQNEDITDAILQYPDYMLMIVSAHFDHTSKSGWEAFNAVQKDAEKEGIFTCALVAEDKNSIEKFRHNNQTAFPFYTGDYKVCLTIGRTNPNVLLLKEGTVIAKWSWRDLPEFAEIKQMYFADRPATEVVVPSVELFRVGEEVSTKIMHGVEPYDAFFLQNFDGEDMTRQVLNDTANACLFIVNSLASDKLTMATWTEIKTRMQALDAAGYPYYVLSASTQNALSAMQANAGLQYMNLIADGDMLHMMMPENTGIITLQNGIVTGKYHEGALPAAEVLMK